MSSQLHCYLLMESFLWLQYYQGFWEQADSICYEDTDTANVTVLTRVSQTATSSLHHFITVLLWRTVTFLDRISVIRNTNTGMTISLQGRACGNLQLPPTGSRAAHARCHGPAHDLPEIQSRTSLSVRTELQERYSDGFVRIFHNPPPATPYSAAQSEPTTVIIIAIIIILIRTSDLSKYCAEDLHIFSCKTAKKLVHCWGTAPRTLLASSTSKFLFMQLSD